MNLVTHIFVVILTVLVGGLSTGFTVYQMNCSEACPSGLYIQNPHGHGDACGGEMRDDADHHNSKDGNSCCSKSSNQAEQDKDDCCDVKELKVFKAFEFVSFICIDLNTQDFDESSDVTDQMQYTFKNGYLKTDISYRGPPDHISLSGKKIRILISSLQYDDNFLI